MRITKIGSTYFTHRYIFRRCDDTIGYNHRVIRREFSEIFSRTLIAAFYPMTASKFPKAVGASFLSSNIPKSIFRTIIKIHIRFFTNHKTLIDYKRIANKFVFRRLIPETGHYTLLGKQTFTLIGNAIIIAFFSS